MAEWLTAWLIFGLVTLKVAGSNLAKVAGFSAFLGGKAVKAVAHVTSHVTRGGAGVIIG